MQRQSLLSWLLPGVLLITSGGCGTIFSSGAQTITIQSEPPGVELFLDGQRVGETPTSLEVDRDTFKSKMVMLKDVIHAIQHQALERS